MSLTPEILQEFKDNLDLFWECVLERVQELLPDLSPAEQETTPILMSESFYATCLFKATQEFYFPGHPYGWGCYYKCGVSLNNGIISIGGIGYVGNDTTAWQEVDINTVTQNVTTYPPRVEKTVDGQLVARIGNDIVLSVYDGSYHNDGVEFYSGMPGSSKGVKHHSSFSVKYGALEYTVNSQGVVTITGESQSSIVPMGSNFYGLCAIKGHPFIGNSKDVTNINDFITKNNSTNNYNTTYTTPDNKTITVYYGDNYIITHVDNDEPVSYDDLKNVFNIAINQINDDNDTDIPTSPDYPVPPEPPSPDDDDIEDQTIGAGANLGSIARLWLLTRQQLQDLHDAFTNAPANYDPLTSFIGVLGFGVQPIKVVGDSLPWTLNPINIRMSSGELWHSGVEAHIVDSQVSAFSFPDIKIKKRYDNFLDYSPYAVHEIFIPMCGWLTLPDIAVDRTISVTYLPDLESMKCRAVVSVVDEDGDRCVIGVKDGIMGAEVPFTNLNHSVWLANLITNAADVTGEIVTGAIGAGFTKTNAKGGTYRPYEGFTIGMAGTLPGAVGNALLSGNVNRTHVVGSNGNRTGFSDGECIMIKSTYHKIDKPDNYDHTIGKVCNKTGQLSEFHGFTVCDNPHIHISALDEEKEEIKRLLEEGVILPDGE